MSPKSDPNCVFCKIVAGQIPCYKTYEDKNFFGFLDIKPLSKGHSLLIPKIHYRWVNDVPNFGAYWEAAKKLALKTQKTVGADFIRYLTLGTEVPHAHLHVVPCFANDIPRLTRQNQFKSFSPEEMKKISSQILSAV